MKRSSLKRGRRRKREPGEADWKTPRKGNCGVCGRRGWVIRHHVVYEQHVRREHGDPWDLRNSLDVGVPLLCDCHAKHHRSGPGRVPIPWDFIPFAAIAFAEELLGRERADAYFERYYNVVRGR